MNTACHVHNRVTLRADTATTLYELWKERKPTVKYFHVFGSKCYILADRDYRRKMDPKSDEGIFLDYSTNSRAYKVYNNRTQVVMESINVVIDDVAKEPVPEVVLGVEAYPETSTQEKVIPETSTEPETNYEEAELNNEKQVKNHRSEFRKIILKSSLLEILIKESEPEELTILSPTPALCPNLNPKM